jgi:hypothetical protein
MGGHGSIGLMTLVCEEGDYILASVLSTSMGQDSVVSIATHHGLKGLGIASWGGQIFRSCPDWSWGPPSLLYDGYQVCFQGVKRPGCGINHLPPSSAEVKERVELYLYCPSGPSWTVLGELYLLHSTPKVFHTAYNSSICYGLKL